MDLLISILALTVSYLFFRWSAKIDYEHISDMDWIEDHTSRVVQRTLFCASLGLINPWFFLGGLSHLEGG